MSRRNEIRLSDEEVRKFLDESKTIILCSNGAGGFPHPMPMWFVRDDDGAILMTTFRKSQKVRNLERDPRVSLLAESGLEYQELKGVVFYGSAELIPDTEQVIDTLMAAAGNPAPADAEQHKAIREGMRKNAEKRVLIRVKPDRIVSWDHSKLGGVY